MKPGTRMAVFSITDGSVWRRAGTATVNKDGSICVELEILPIDGKLHIREEPPTAPAYLEPKR